MRFVRARFLRIFPAYLIFAALAAQQAANLPLSTRGLFAMVVLCCMSRAATVYVTTIMLTLGAFSLWPCWRLSPFRVPWRGDFSHGLFLYGYPVQQMIVAIHPVVSPQLLAALAIPATLVFAMASWRWLEQPLLRLKQSRPLQPAPLSKP